MSTPIPPTETVTTIGLRPGINWRPLAQCSRAKVGCSLETPAW